MRDLVYISYSQRDKEFHRELREILDRDVRIKDILWDDTKIRKGADVKQEIAEHVARAQIMVMLVSPNYLAPDCSAWDGEIKPAMQAREQGELIVLWIPVGAVCASDSGAASAAASRAWTCQERKPLKSRKAPSRKAAGGTT